MVLDLGNEGLKALQPHTLTAQCSFPSRVLPSSIPFIPWMLGCPWKGFTGCTEKPSPPLLPQFSLQNPQCLAGPAVYPPLCLLSSSWGSPGNSFPLTLCKQKAPACAWGCVFHWSCLRLANPAPACRTKPGKYLFCQAFQLGLI